MLTQVESQGAGHNVKAQEKVWSLISSVFKFEEL